MDSTRLDTHQKAVQINLDKSKYGTFAEIGAGQEVARWFFRVGGAAGTIAKSISAYDMTVSDAIYGASGRYVSRQRLETMLDHEYGLMNERLAEKRGESTRFFVFADTVAAKSYTRKDNWHGWMGIRFQNRPGHPPSQVILHFSLLDRESTLQQETVGILGVNLVHAALYEAAAADLLGHLLDGLSHERVEVDLVEFTGPAFAGVDNRLMSLELVHCGLTDAAMFTADGKVVQAADAFYKRPILVLRGRFRPVTTHTVNMLACALDQFRKEPANQGEDPLVITEMTLHHLQEGDAPINDRDYLDRVNLLRTLGRPVLISNFGEFYRLSQYLQRHTSKLIGLAVGVSTLREIFEEKYYTHLAGGILESFGRMFKNDLKLYVYPLLDPVAGTTATAADFRVSPRLQHLYNYLVDNGHIQPIRDYKPEFLGVFSRDVYRKLREGDPTWVHDVPPNVALLICQRHMMGYDPAKFEEPAGAPRHHDERIQTAARKPACIGVVCPRSSFDATRARRPPGEPGRISENAPMPRRIAAVVLAFSVLISPTTRAAQDAPRQEEPARKAPARRNPLDGLDGYIEAGMKRWDIPGLAIGIVKDDHLVYAKGFGVREKGRPEPVTEKTFFAMASQSKAFTATALGLLVSEGKLRWDDPATKHLPWFQMFDPYVTRELTVRDMLCHRCGLSTWQGDLVWYGSELTRREVLERVRYIEPESSFRSRYGYCNLTFAAAGEIIPTITGVSWEDYLRSRFFEPMGMTRTKTDLRAVERLDDVARPHTLVRGKIVPIAYRATANTAPAGAINSCVKDWAQWIRLQLNHGTLDGRKVVPAEIIRETRSPQTITPAQPDGDKLSFSAYGLGWMLRAYEGRLMIAHGGGLDGMLSLSILVPEEKLGVVVLSNYDEQEFYASLPFHVIDAYLGVTREDGDEKLFKARKERERRERDEEEKDKSDGGSGPSLERSGYFGIYHHPVLGRATVSAKDGKLFIEIDRNPGLRGELKHRRFDTFRVEWADPYLRTSLIPFRLNERGQADEFRMRVRPDFVDPMEYRFTRKP